MVNWLLSDPADRRFLWITGVSCVIASIGLSIWAIYSDPIINNDGVGYVRAAELFGNGQWSLAFADFKWPFYSFFMWMVSALTGLSLKGAGHVINTVCFSGVILLFIAVIRALGGKSKRLTVLAAIVALAHPAFNEYRSFVIRDPGYLAGYLAALYCLLLCQKDSSWRARVAVLVALVAASLFRIEGVVFLFLSPLLFVMVSQNFNQRRWPLLLIAATPLIGLGVILAGWFLVPDGKMGFWSVLSNPHGVVVTVWEQVGGTLSSKLDLLREEFLGRYSEGYAYVLFGLTVTTIVTSAILSELTIPFAVLAVYGYTSGLCFGNGGQRRVWLALLSINLAILLVFVLIMLFLAPRYMLTLSVTALLAVPFVLEHVLKRIRWRDLKGLRLLVAVIVLLWIAGESISGIHNPATKLHLRESGQWLQPYTVGRAGSLVTNDKRILYYAGRYMDRTHIERDLTSLLRGLEKQRWEGAVFVAVRLRDGEDEVGVVSALGLEHIKRFENHRGDRVLIFSLDP